MMAIMGNINILLLTFLGLLQYVTAQYNDTAAFKIPANFAAGRTAAMRPVYQVGSTLDVEWETTQEEYRIVLMHINNLTSFSSTRGNTVFSKSQANSETGGFNWTIDLQSFDLDPNVFFLVFQPIDTTAALNISAYTQYFNLTNEAVTTTSSAVSTTLPLTGATDGPTANPVPNEPTTTAVPSSQPSQSAPASESSSGLSSGGAIGLGVGVGVGGAALLGAAIFFWLRHRNKQQAAQRDMHAAPAYTPPSAPYTDHAQGTSGGSQDTKPPMASYINQGSPQPSELQAPLSNFHGSDTSSQARYGSPQQVYEMPVHGTHGR